MMLRLAQRLLAGGLMMLVVCVAYTINHTAWALFFDGHLIPPNAFSVVTFGIAGFMILAGAFCAAFGLFLEA